MAKIAIFVENLYEELELWYPALRLREAGHTVILAGPATGERYKGKYGYPATAQIAIGDLKTEEFDAVIIPGGFAPDYLRRCPASIAFVKAMAASGKIVSAICHGVWIPASAGILEGKRVTSFFAIKDDIVHAGGKWEDSEVVRDGNLITARKPEDLPSFMKALLAALEGR